MTERHADIIFYKEDSRILYKVDLGTLENLLLMEPSGDYGGDRIITVGNAEISFKRLRELIKIRRERMLQVAEFLSKSQKNFLAASDLHSAELKFRSYRQQDFIEYLWEKYSQEKKDTPEEDRNEFIRKNESWVSRVINEKDVKVPFSNEIFDLKEFFNELRERINILVKAFEMNMKILEYTPLSASDQADIVNRLQRLNEYAKSKPISSTDVRKILWPRLKTKYPEGLWKELAISGVPGREKGKKDMNHIINAVVNFFEEIHRST